jgi:hypothetical protein
VVLVREASWPAGRGQCPHGSLDKREPADEQQVDDRGLDRVAGYLVMANLEGVPDFGGASRMSGV